MRSQRISTPVYDTLKLKLMLRTEAGKQVFRAIRDNIIYHLRLSGAVRHEEAVSVVVGQKILKEASIHRLIFIGEIRAASFGPNYHGGFCRREGCIYTEDIMLDLDSPLPIESLAEVYIEGENDGK